MYKFVYACLYLLIAVYICVFLLVYILPLFGFQFIQVEYDNAQLDLSASDSLLIYKKNFDKIKQGDVVVYKKPGQEISIRKIVSTDSSSEIITVLVNENKFRDITEAVSYKNIYGVKIINLPKAQAPIAFLSSFSGKMLTTLILGVFLVIKFGLGGIKKKSY